MSDEHGILDQMERFETTIGTLYKLFADHFPQGRPFWMHLAVEEKAHASHIRMLIEKVKAGELSFDPDRLDEGLLHNACEEIFEIIAAFHRSPLDFKQAIAITIKIENMIFDKLFYAVFLKDAEPIRRIFKILEDETKMHAQRARDFLANLPNG